MTIKKFVFILFLQWVVFSILKYYFFGKEILTNSNTQHLIYWVLVIIVAVVLVRSLGVINYFEGIFTAFLWFIVGIISDLIILTALIGYGMYKEWQFWVGYLLMALAVFFFHRKRHVEIRKQHQVEAQKQH